jgi:orotate phosphoribosyltransferase
MHRSHVGWENELMRIGALWSHDGNPARPHSLLTSGKHSAGFCNCEIIKEDPVLLADACEDLVEQVAGLELIFPVDRVIGPAMGAITIAHEVAEHTSRYFQSSCRSGFVEKDPCDPTRMILSRTTLRPGECVLLVEDVLTTGGSVERAAAAIEQAGGEVMPVVLVLVNRSRLQYVGERAIISLVDRPIPAWDAAECQLCAEGSVPLRPKGAENWSRLMAAYE